LAASLVLAAACDPGPASDGQGLEGHGGHVHGGGGDGGGGHGGHGEDPAAALACEDLRGAAVAVAASADPLAAPPIAADRRRYDVALADLGGFFGGAVSFDAPDAGPFVLFVDADLTVVVEGPGGAPVTIHDRTAGSATCPGTIAASMTVATAAGLHTLSFGPTPVAATVGVVLEAGQAPP
jgi:hypothetical protein